MNTQPSPILSIELPFNEKLAFYSLTFGSGGPAAAITSGFYGDEHNGMYVCHKLISFLRAVEKSERPGWRLNGRVKIFPALNPLGTLTDRRYWPFDQRDINRSFPGASNGETTERIAAAVLGAIGSCRACVDLYSGSRFFEELPQVRLDEAIDKSGERAAVFGLPLIWRRSASPLLSGSLARNLNQRGVPTFVIKFGSANRIHKEYCQWVFAGLLKFLRSLEILEGDGEEIRVSPSGVEGAPASHAVGPDGVESIISQDAGLFVADLEVGCRLNKDEIIGRVLDPIGGGIVADVRAPVSGLLFTLRSNPILFSGSLIARTCPS